MYEVALEENGNLSAVVFRVTLGYAVMLGRAYRDTVTLVLPLMLGLVKIPGPTYAQPVLGAGT